MSTWKDIWGPRRAQGHWIALTCIQQAENATETNTDTPANGNETQKFNCSILENSIS